jgi:hypothetical protein
VAEEEGTMPVGLENERWVSGQVSWARWCVGLFALPSSPSIIIGKERE